MRFSRFQLIFIVAIVALLVANVYLAIGYFGAVSRKASLQSDINDKEAAIARMPSQGDIDTLTRQLDAAEQKLADEAPFPEVIDPLELLDHIIYAVQKAGLDSYTYKPGAGRTEKIGTSTYKALPYAITTSERLSELIDFLELLEELPYDTITIRDVSLTSAGETWNLRFNLVIITQ